MSKNTDVQKIPLQLSQGCVIASIQIDLNKEVLTQFRQDLLNYISHTGARNVIIDLSGIEIMNIEDFNALNQTLSMANLMGAKTIFTGFQPGVVSSLVDFNVEFDHINGTLDLDNAFDLMKHLHSQDHNFSDEDLDPDLENDLIQEDENNESL